MGSKLIFIIIGVVVVIGLVIGLGVTGIVPIPGLTPPKKKHAKAKGDPKVDEAKKPDDAKTDVASKPKDDAKQAELKKLPDAKAATDKLAAGPKPDLDKGYAKVAAVWSEIEPAKIEAILQTDYKPETAAPILKRMDEDKVAAILTIMKPKDAAAYSDALAKEASKPPAPAPTT